MPHLIIPSHLATPHTTLLPVRQALYLTLLEVALALKHLHSMQLVHCDVKAANVLLKSSNLDPRCVRFKVVKP